MGDRYSVRIRAAIERTDGTVDAVLGESISAEIISCMKKLDIERTYFTLVPDELSTFDFYLVIHDGMSPLDAVLTGADLLRTAAHDALVYTDRWPGLEDWKAMLREYAVEARRLGENEDRLQRLQLTSA